MPSDRDSKLSRRAERPTAIQRADADMERGDYGLARRRLGSYLSTKGYDADILATLGRVSYEMHDYYHAGRFWLTSNAEGERVESCIDLFVDYGGPDPHSIVGQLPRFARPTSLDSYTKLVQERLRRLGLADAVLARAHPSRNAGAMGVSDRLKLAGCLAAFVLFVVTFAVGLKTAISWFWRTLFGE